MSFGTMCLTLFFRQQLHQCYFIAEACVYGQGKKFYIYVFFNHLLLRGLQFSFADKPGQVCPSPVSDFQTYNLNTLNTHCGLLLLY